MEYLSLTRGGIVGFALFALSCTAQAEQPNSPYGPLDRLLKSKTDSLCFRRDYNAAHLKRHSGQMTETIMLSFRDDGVRIALKQKDRKAPRYMSASCNWSERRNERYPESHPIQAFRKDAGYDCIVIMSPGSAQEGGVVVIDPASDGQSLVLYIEDSVAVQDSLSEDRNVLTFNLGREDRQFRLTRTDAASCKRMDDGLASLGL
ncbi:hypothetical protein [Bradyrhizobium sp. SYSU BS000235]|uniref:hypothetical protein n=1 Tax=Bradyrhizobium sp. SYSU BS000235 TaxID=3411332 RepID=UPI003C7065FD